MLIKRKLYNTLIVPIVICIFIACTKKAESKEGEFVGIFRTQTWYSAPQSYSDTSEIKILKLTLSSDLNKYRLSNQSGSGYYAEFSRWNFWDNFYLGETNSGFGEKTVELFEDSLFYTADGYNDISISSYQFTFRGMRL